MLYDKKVNNELENFLRLKKDFKEEKLNKSLKEINIINKEWFNSWKKYVDYEKKNIKKSNIVNKNLKQSVETKYDNPGPINNKILIEDSKEYINCLINLSKENEKHELKPEYVLVNKEMKENIKVISNAMWKFFFKIYGGGPEIKRKVIEVNNDEKNINYDIFYKILNIYFIFKIDNEIDEDIVYNSKIFKLFLSSFTSVMELKERIKNFLVYTQLVDYYKKFNNEKQPKIYIRLWKIEEDYGFNKFIKYLQEKEIVC